MHKARDIEDSDAFFNMRRRFYQESRDMVLAEKEPDKPFSQQSKEGARSGHGAHPRGDPLSRCTTATS